MATTPALFTSENPGCWLSPIIDLMLMLTTKGCWILPKSWTLALGC